MMSQFEAMKPLLSRLTTPRAMVVRMPEGDGFGPTNVKVVSVDSEDMASIIYKEAWVGNDEDVEVGEQQSFPIFDITDISNPANTTNVILYRGERELIMQLQAENQEEADMWMQGLMTLKGLLSSPEHDTSTRSLEEVRSSSIAQLLALRADIDDIQNRLAEAHADEDEMTGREPDSDFKEPCGEPEAEDQNSANGTKQAQQIQALMNVNEQKEKTIQRLTHRLEHALAMLKAVHEMYDQQKLVLNTQQRLIEEMKTEREFLLKKPITSSLITPTNSVPFPSMSSPIRPAQDFGTGTPSDTKDQVEQLQRMMAMMTEQENAQPEGEEDMGDLMQLLQQVESLKSSIDGLEQMAGLAQVHADDIHNGGPVPFQPKQINLKTIPEHSAQEVTTPKIREIPDDSITPKMSPKHVTSSATNHLATLNRITESLSAPVPATDDPKAKLSDLESKLSNVQALRQFMATMGISDDINDESIDEEDDNDVLEEDIDDGLPNDLAGLSANLQSLEAEKHNMQQQLRDAQGEQAAMMQKLQEMHKLMECLGSVTGGQGSPKSPGPR